MSPESARNLAMDASSVRGGLYALTWFLRGLAMGGDATVRDAVELAARTLELAKVVDAAIAHEAAGRGEECDG